jgi:hypothetical protein
MNIPIYFFLPKFFIGFWSFRARTIFVAMPKTAMEKNTFLYFGNVISGFPGKSFYEA